LRFRGSGVQVLWNCVGSGFRTFGGSGCMGFGVLEFRGSGVYVVQTLRHAGAQGSRGLGGYESDGDDDLGVGDSGV